MAILLTWTSGLDFLPSKAGYFLFCRSVLYISQSNKCQSELRHRMVTCLVTIAFTPVSSHLCCGLLFGWVVRTGSSCHFIMDVPNTVYSCAMSHGQNQVWSLTLRPYDLECSEFCKNGLLTLPRSVPVFTNILIFRIVLFLEFS